MNKIFLSIVIVSFLFASCNDEGNEETVRNNGNNSEATTKDPLMHEIRDLEAKVAADTAFDRTRSLRLLRVYQEYYNAHPKDTTAANYLFEAANLAQKLDKHQRAIELFIEFHDAYPSSHRGDDAVYNIAYIYDARLNNKEKAKLYYNKVIELYPQSLWAREATGALALLEMSDEELIRYLEEKNK